jgi:hypothetical protein
MQGRAEGTLNRWWFINIVSTFRRTVANAAEGNH